MECFPSISFVTGNIFSVISYFKLKTYPLHSLLAHLLLSPRFSIPVCKCPLSAFVSQKLVSIYKTVQVSGNRKWSSRIGSTKVSKHILIFPLVLKPADMTGLGLNVFSCNSSESNNGPHDLISLSKIFTNILEYQTDFIKFTTNGSHILYQMWKTGS